MDKITSIFHQVAKIQTCQNYWNMYILSFVNRRLVWWVVLLH